MTLPVSYALQVLGIEPNRSTIAALAAFAAHVREHDGYVGKRTIAAIQARVATYFDIPLAEMKSARRARAVARPRQVAMYLCKHLTGRSVPEIGRRFGDRDHTTVLHGIKQIARLRIEDADIGAAVEQLERELSA